MYPNGCQPGAIYGLAKVHKQGCPLRPVISMLNTPQYGLAKYLDTIIKPVIPDTYMLSSTDHFLTTLSSLELSNSYKLASYDVESLFTNVPLAEIIDIASDFVYSDDSPTKPRYEAKHFKKLLAMATSGEFLYKDKLYRQIDGVSMGSPLGPTLANLFLANLERSWLSTPNAPVYYFRYVDDVFAVFKTQSDTSLEFLNFLNEQHPNLKFTIEKAASTLPFLDTTISLNDHGYESSVHRKKTFTSLLLNFHAYAPLHWKTALIRCLLQRAFRISSSWALFHQEILKLKEIFIANAYPAALFESIVKRFLANVFDKTTQSPDIPDQQNKKVLVLPYLGRVSTSLKRKLTHIEKRLNIKIRIIFKPFKVSRFFSLKSRCPKLLRSRLVYEFQCPVEQGVTYIGKTKRHLATRVKEHLHPSGNSAIAEHIATCTCHPSSDNFRVLRQCKDEYEMSLCEALLIKQDKPVLNQSLLNDGQSLFLKLY